MWSCFCVVSIAKSTVGESRRAAHKYCHKLRLAYLILLLATFVSLAAEEAPVSKREESLQVQKDAKERRIVARDTYAYSQKLDAKQIPVLEQGKDMNLALTAAWRRARQAPSATSAARFIGFMEAKAGAELPWELQWDIYSNCNASKSAPSGVNTFDFQRSSIFDRRCYLRAGVVLALEAGDKLRYERGTEVVRFDAELIRAATPSHEFIQLWTFHDVAVLGSYDDSGSPFRIWCLRKADGQLLWTQVVWADQADMILTKSGSWRHNVHITANDDRILVLGTNGSIYSEEFDLNSGRNRFRFSSSCWNGSRASFFVGKSKNP
jgi:hypothetical protein